MPLLKQKASRAVIHVRSNADVQSCERMLDQLPTSPSAELTVRLASNFGALIFADIWAAILVGTICQYRYTGLQIVTSGYTKWDPKSTFANSLSGLTAIQMTDRVRTDSSNGAVDIDNIANEIGRNRLGILEAGPGKTRTLVEFDPQYSVAAKIRGKNARTKFQDLIAEFRRELELGYLHHDKPVWSIGTYPAHLATFISELHENG